MRGDFPFSGRALCGRGPAPFWTVGPRSFPTWVWASLRASAVDARYIYELLVS